MLYRGLLGVFCIVVPFFDVMAIKRSTRRLLENIGTHPFLAVYCKPKRPETRAVTLSRHLVLTSDGQTFCVLQSRTLFCVSSFPNNLPGAISRLSSAQSSVDSFCFTKDSNKNLD